jgi:hypothetical protein
LKARESVSRSRRRKPGGPVDETAEERKRRLTAERVRKHRAAKKEATPAAADEIPGETPEERTRRKNRERQQRRRERQRAESVTE